MYTDAKKYTFPQAEKSTKLKLEAETPIFRLVCIEVVFTYNKVDLAERLQSQLGIKAANIIMLCGMQLINCQVV